MLTRFFKDGVVYGLAGLFARSVSIITLPLYTRILSPTDFGVIDLTLLFTVFCGVIIPFGISSGVARFFPDEKTEDGKVLVASSGLWFISMTHLVFVVAALTFAEPLMVLTLGSAKWSQVYYLGLVMIVTGGFFYYFQNLLRWRLEPKRYVFCSLVSTFVTVGIALLAIFVARLGVAGIFIGQICGNAVGGALAWGMSRDLFRLRFSKASLMAMLWFSVPLLPVLVGEFVTNYIDRMSIRTLMSLEDLGRYGIGFRLASLVGLIMIGFSSSLTPLVYANYQKHETPAEIARIFRFFLLIALPAVLFLALFSKEMLWIFTGPAYYSAWIVMPILAPGLLLISMFNFAPGIDIAKKTKVSAMIQVATALVSVAFNYLLIPLFGIAGSALATLLSGIFSFSAYMAYSQRYYAVPHQWGRLAAAVCLVLLVGSIGIESTILLEFNLTVTLIKATAGLLAVIGIARILLSSQEIDFATAKMGSLLNVKRQ
jgi:O-antigen/teichoic acid export membrane protein